MCLIVRGAQTISCDSLKLVLPTRTNGQWWRPFTSFSRLLAACQALVPSQTGGAEHSISHCSGYCALSLEAGRGLRASHAPWKDKL